MQIPESRARLIALDLVELDRLRSRETLHALEISARDNRIGTLEQIAAATSQQLELANRLAESYRVELEAERQLTSGDNTFSWVLRMIGAAAVGFVLGSVL